jgi:F-type H+-transporting ATPase subunit b
MDINATLIGQMITFALFFWFTMKYVWPPLSRVLEERRKKIADGLAAGEEGQKQLELARIKSKEQLREAKGEASRIIEQAHQRANRMIEEAKDQARIEGERLLSLAEGEIDRLYNQAKEKLLRHISTIAVAGAERILQKEVDKNVNNQLVNELVDEV